VRENECQIEENERHLVGQIVHAVHDETQAVGLKSGNRFDHEDRGVERGGCSERLAVMGHAERVAPILGALDSRNDTAIAVQT
jgi:hypothetical protein